jgi:hypothetical protein
MDATNRPPEPVGIPNLGSVIRTDDLQLKEVKKNGRVVYTADYVSWCRVTQLLREHAPGWQFHLRLALDGDYVWRAPDGTGYVVGYFSGPNGQETADLLQAVMDNGNYPVPWERISARDVTDTHRRALCTAAAFSFGLAWQLWAREPIEDPHREPPAPADGAELQAAVIKRLKDAGVSNAGLIHVLKQAGGPTAKGWGQVPAATLRKLATGKLTDAKVQEWNDAAAEAEADAADVPLTHLVPAAAAA